MVDDPTLEEASLCQTTPWKPLKLPHQILSNLTLAPHSPPLPTRNNLVHVHRVAAKYISPQRPTRRRGVCNQHLSDRVQILCGSNKVKPLTHCPTTLNQAAILHRIHIPQPPTQNSTQFQKRGRYIHAHIDLTASKASHKKIKLAINS